jgi:hypothetical protein
MEIFYEIMGVNNKDGISMNNEYRDYPYFIIAPDDEAIYKDAQEAAEAFQKAIKRPNRTQVMVMTAPGIGHEVAGVNANGQAYLNTLDFQSSPMTQSFQNAYRNLPAPAAETAPESERPYYAVHGNNTKFYDAEKAAEAFYKAGSSPSIQAMVMKGVGYGHEVAGNNGRGEAFLNKLDFQNDPMTKAFQSAWEKLVEVLGPRPITEPAPQVAAPEPIVQAVAEPVTAAPAVEVAAPEAPQEPEYFSVPGESTKYYDAHEAALAFHKAQKTAHTSVSVMKGVGYGHEVAGVNSQGDAFLNKLDFQSHPMTQEFQKAYQAILDHEAKLNGPWYSVNGSSTKYFDAKEAAQAFHASEKNSQSNVMVMSGPGYGFESARVNSDGQAYLNKLEFQSNPMQIEFQKAYEEILANEKANTVAAQSPTLLAVIDLAKSDSLSTYMDKDLMSELLNKPAPATKKHEDSALSH